MMNFSLPVIFATMVVMFFVGAIVVFTAFKKDAAKQIEQQKGDKK